MSFAQGNIKFNSLAPPASAGTLTGFNNTYIPFGNAAGALTDSLAIASPTSLRFVNNQLQVVNTTTTVAVAQFRSTGSSAAGVVNICPVQTNGQAFLTFGLSPLTYWAMGIDANNFIFKKNANPGNGTIILGVVAASANNSAWMGSQTAPTNQNSVLFIYKRNVNMSQLCLPQSADVLPSSFGVETGHLVNRQGTLFYQSFITGTSGSMQLYPVALGENTFRFGNIVAGAAALDTTQYLSVLVNGVAYKIALST